MTTYEILSLIMIIISLIMSIISLLKDYIKKYIKKKKIRNLYKLFENIEKNSSIIIYNKIKNIGLNKFLSIMNFYYEKNDESDKIIIYKFYNTYYQLHLGISSFMYSYIQISGYKNDYGGNSNYICYMEHGELKQKNVEVLKDFLIYFKEQCKRNKIKLEKLRIRIKKQNK